MSFGPTESDPTAVLAAYWAEGEGRLYPLAASNPDAYMAAVDLVRAVADQLAGVATLDSLVECWDRRSELVADGAGARSGAAASGLGEAEVAGAAFAIRRRELLAEQAEHRRREIIAAARRAGEAWAVIYERGDLDAGLVNPYQCVELHLETGLAVVSAVEPDPATMGPNYVVSVVAMNNEEPRAKFDLTVFEDNETSDPVQFQRHRIAMKQQVEAPAAGARSSGP